MKAARYQELTVRCLYVPPFGGYTLTEYRVEEWAGGNIFVGRKYVPDHAPSLEYSEGFKVGPRGGVTPIYSHTNY